MKMDKITLAAEKRSIVGRKVKTLRKEGYLPANVFGKGIKSESLQVKLSDFQDTYKKIGETGLLYLSIKNGKVEEKPVLVSNVQLQPVSDTPIHVDFHQVDLKEKVTAAVPVEISGQAPAEKGGIGTVVQYIDEIEVEALPTNLPEKFILDISNLAEVDQAIFVKDLPVDKAKVDIKTDAEGIIAKVEPPQKEEVAPVAEVPAEGEAPAEGVPEGEVPAEGEAPVAEENKPQEEKAKE